MENLVDPAILASAGYTVSLLDDLQSVDDWYARDALQLALLIAHPDSAQAFDLYRTTAKDHPSLPVVVVTGKSVSAFMELPHVAGRLALLTVPVDGDLLLTTLHNLFAVPAAAAELSSIHHFLAQIADPAILVDANQRISLLNQAARQLFQLGDHPLGGSPVNETILNTDFLDIFKPDRTYPFFSEVSLDDARVFNAHASLISGLGVLVLMQEITHLKELDRIKTEFVNNVSHDLRSPLTAIYGFVGLLDRVGSINAQQAEFIRHIQASVHHITSLINDLMDLGRLEADYNQQLEEVDFIEIIRHSLETLDYQLNEKMQRLELSLPEDKVTILGNPIHLQRMITNLVENAIKFTRPLGQIAIRCRCETDQLILEIADNGPGIPLADQPHIFEKFYRGSNLSQTTTGTGLGLSIVKTVIDKHHGRIWLDSSPAGTTFSVILPYK